jgi:hypothetical protein
VLGTDGFGRSDYRVKLRKFFEVDRHYVAVAALKALADDGAIKPATVAEAIAKYKIDDFAPDDRLDPGNPLVHCIHLDLPFRRCRVGSAGFFRSPT